MRNKIFLSFGKGLLWTLLTLVFGLLQLWVVLASDYMMVVHKFKINEILLNGTLLFFTSAVVSAICIDYFLGSTGDVHKVVAGLIYFVFPFFVLGLCILLFLLGTFYRETDFDAEVVSATQVVIISMTMIYSVGTKALMFFQEDKS